MPPQGSRICCFGILIILNCGHLQSSKSSKRLSLNATYLLKDRSSKRKSVVTDPLPESLINQGRLSLIKGEETRSPHHTQTNCYKLSYLPPILLKAHLPFLKIIYSLLRGLCPFSPSPIKMVFKPEL